MKNTTNTIKAISVGDLDDFIFCDAPEPPCSEK